TQEELQCLRRLRRTGRPVLVINVTVVQIREQQVVPALLVAVDLVDIAGVNAVPYFVLPQGQGEVPHVVAAPTRPADEPALLKCGQNHTQADSDQRDDGKK